MTKEVGRGELCLKMAISHLTQNVVQVAVTISTLNRDVVMSYVKGKSLPFASPCFFFFLLSITVSNMFRVELIVQLALTYPGHAHV